MTEREQFKAAILDAYDDSVDMDTGELNVAKFKLLLDLVLDDHFPKKILKLTLCKSPFDVMATGEKTFEFRKPTIGNKRLLFDKNGNPRKYDLVLFRNGYGNQRPFFLVEFISVEISINYARFTYSNGLNVEIEPGDYIISLGKLIKV